MRTSPNPDPLRQRLRALGLYGLLAHADAVREEPWLPRLLEIEDSERQRRSLERRLHNACLGTFRALADFDWTWPTQIDRGLLEELFTLAFIAEAANIVLLGPNGLGKTLLAKNLAHQAILQGHTARFTLASDMLHDLAAQDSDASLARRLRRYLRPTVLAIDEVGYLSYGNRHADLLFELVSRRYQARSTLVTTNRPFAEWGEVFPNAACVVSLIDRLIHNAEVIAIEGASYRLKEAKERAEQRAKRRRKNTEELP